VSICKARLFELGVTIRALEPGPGMRNGENLTKKREPKIYERPDSRVNQNISASMLTKCSENVVQYNAAYNATSNNILKLTFKVRILRPSALTK